MNFGWFLLQKSHHAYGRGSEKAEGAKETGCMILANNRHQDELVSWGLSPIRRKKREGVGERRETID